MTKLSFPLPAEMTRADLYSVKLTPQPRAVLVLCPGRNASGRAMVEEPRWQEFARRHDLGLLGISFASKAEVLNDWRGYPVASRGSGQMVLDGVQQVYGRDLPVFFYGISCGALFIGRFLEWRPDRVGGFCAYAGEGVAQTRQDKAPPGLIACGEYDACRYGAILTYFKQGRAQGKPWLWVSLPKTGHAVPRSLDDFVRQYFAALLSSKEADGAWVDIDGKDVVSWLAVERIPSVTAWLPQRELLAAWGQIHEP